MKFITGFTGVLALAVAVFATPVKRDAATVEKDITAINAEVVRLNRDIATFVAGPTAAHVAVSIYQLLSLLRVYAEQRLDVDHCV